jgi:hypothetical protein
VTDLRARVTIAEFLHPLRGVKPGGSEKWDALCPAHDDHKPSLSVRAESGRILIYCQVGCTTEKICDALGIRLQDLFNKPSPAKIVTTYLYVDLDGTPLRHVVRHDGPKRFYQESFNRLTSEWVKSVKGVPMVPYRLPELIRAIQGGKRVFVTEGESDADSAAEHGLVATTSPGGAAVAWPPDFIAHFQGAVDVIVVADADKPGREAAIRRARCLQGIVQRVRLIDFGFDKPSGYDLSDFFVGGGSVEQLLELAVDVNAFEPLLRETAIDAERKAATTYVMVFDDVLARPDLTGDMKLLLSFLRRSVEQGWPPPSYQQMAAAMGRGKPQTAGWVRRLIAKGFLECKVRTEGGRQRKNRYTVLDLPPLNGLESRPFDSDQPVDSDGETVILPQAGNGLESRPDRSEIQTPIDIDKARTVQETQKKKKALNSHRHPKGPQI